MVRLESRGVFTAIRAMFSASFSSSSPTCSQARHGSVCGKSLRVTGNHSNALPLSWQMQAPIIAVPSPRTPPARTLCGAQ